MRNYVEKLLDCLSLYQSLVRQGCLGEEHTEEIKKLNAEIEELQNMVRSGGDYTTFDFKTLKKDLARLFHPDIFKPPVDLLENPDELLGTTFGVMKQIDDFKKSKGDSSFAYNTATESAYRNATDEQYQRRRRASYTESSRTSNTSYQNTNRNAQNSSYNNNSSQETEEFYEEWEGFTPYEGEETNPFSITQFVTDRFNAIFRGIPSTSDDYEKLLARYEKTEEDLLSQIRILEKCMHSSKNEAVGLRNERSKAVSDVVVDGWYEQKLNELWSIKQRALRFYEHIKGQQARRDQELHPTMSQLYENWLQEAQNYAAAYDNLLKKYQMHRHNLADVDYQQMEERINKMYETLLEYYTDRDKAYNDIRADVLRNDPVMQRLTEKAREAREAHNAARDEFENFRRNPELHKRNRRKQTERHYETEIEFADSDYDQKKRKKDKIEKKLAKIQEKRKKLVEQYGDIFAPQDHRKK